MHDLLTSISLLYDIGLTFVIAVIAPDPWEALRRILTAIGFLRLACQLRKWRVNKVRKAKRKLRKAKRQSRKP
ncbi:MAG: hypothetical protein EON60_13060 [Alphaproteobacteria bacterium]|nr:MAG: hypothetical protein EON60_13060 [Alphaproteobacteria bacterium]